jgi:hypothetical protein
MTVHQTKENMKEISKISANTVKTLQQISSDYIHKITSSSSA